VKNKMILDVLAIGLVVSAFLAVYLDEAVYSVASLACTLFLMALVYALNNAIFAAIFQLTISAGTLAVLFLSGEMLSGKPSGTKSLKRISLVLVAAIFLSFPAILLSAPTTTVSVFSEISFSQALWNLRSVDIILQGLVIMTVAFGIAIVLRKRKKGED